MPNWKKIALSGSSPEFLSLNVDTSISAGSITGSIDFSNLTNTPTLISSSDQVTSSLDSKYEISNRGIISSSAQITGSLNLESITGSFTGSFTGDGSGLTNISIDVGEVATVADTFTNTTSKTVTHGFNTKNVIVSVYNDNDEVIVPSTIITTDVNTVDITLDTLTSGRIVVAKGGHIVTSQTYRETVSGGSTYVLNHNLGQDYCIVQAYSSSKKQVLPAEIESLTTGSVSVQFDNNFQGVIVIKS